MARSKLHIIDSGQTTLLAFPIMVNRLRTGIGSEGPADRTLYWEKEKMPIVADPHFGKAQVFRDRGIPVPQGATAGDLRRLSCRIDQLSPKLLLFLGDLIHGRIESPDRFHRLIGCWRRRHRKVQLMLVTGNHDIRAGKTPSVFGFDRIDTEYNLETFAFCHQPQRGQVGYTVAGHLHPAVTVRGRGRLRETLPCFCFGPRAAILPAFGSFTGLHVIRPAPEDRVYVVAGEEILRTRNGPLD